MRAPRAFVLVSNCEKTVVTMRTLLAAITALALSCGPAEINGALPNDGWLRCADAHPLFCGWSIMKCCPIDHPYFCEGDSPTCEASPRDCPARVGRCEMDVRIQF